MCFFFFQAEDGIRDYKVTGVQTCALPICGSLAAAAARIGDRDRLYRPGRTALFSGDRKSTRLNSSHLVISYAVFCLKKKKNYSVPEPILPSRAAVIQDCYERCAYNRHSYA